jgi:anti-sigma factor RsiW
LNGPSRLDPRLGCPELEALAAFADGRLAGGERAAVVAHLADCDACRELVAETLALAADERPTAAGEEVASGGDVVPFRKPKRAPRRRLLAGVAAAAAVVVAALLWLRSSPPAAEVTLAALADEPRLLERLGADWAEPLWSVTRGDGPAVSDAARAFRLGVRSADLELALGAGDRRAARRFAAECALLLGDVPLADPAAHLYRELARRAGEPGEAVAALAADATTAARLAREAVEPQHGELGRWSETGRLAAAAGARVGLPALPALPAALPADAAALARAAARPELDAPPERRAAAFAELVARGGDLR